MICPSCKGAKVVRALVYFRPGGCRPVDLACSTCRGSGEVSDRQMAWLEAGERLRLQRVSKAVGLRERAKALGISPAELSDAEHGRIDPAPFFEADPPKV